MDITFLRECFSYNKTTGNLKWKRRPRKHFTSAKNFSMWNKKFPGEVAGWIDSKTNTKYKMVQVSGKTYSQHRVAWAIFYGYEPQFQIDHINGKHGDNRISNLRDVSQAENTRNRRIPTNNKSGVIGVSWRKESNAWHAQIQHNGKKRHIGLFETIEEARAARITEEKRLKFHANHGRVK